MHGLRHQTNQSRYECQKFRPERIMNSEGAIALQPDIDGIHSLTLALCEQAIVVAEALRAFGNLADFGHQEKAGSVESWIFMIWTHFYGTKMCYQLRQQCHGS